MQSFSRAPRGWILGAVLGVLAPTVASAQAPLTLPAEADTSVRIEWDGSANTNWGCEQVLMIGTGRWGATKPDGAADALRSLVRFDLSSVPAGAYVVSARLELVLSQFGAYSQPGSVYAIDVHRLIDSSNGRTPWVEGNGAFNPPGGSGCVGVDPADGVAWLGAGDNPFKPFEAANNVTQPDFDPAVVASTTLTHGVQAPGTVVGFDITALATQWLSGAVANHGVVLRDLTDRTGQTDSFRTVNFATKETRPFYGVNYDGPKLVLTFDTAAPSITCEAADGLWHAANVSLACTAEDTGSGLANAADASFVLVTSVAAGQESGNAFTDSRTVCDRANNCATVGPIGDNKIDRRAPDVQIVSPTAMTYTLGQAVPANYACTDNGSGATTCAGPVPSGAPLPLTNPGSFSFTVQAQDAVGNSSNGSVAYQVAYRVCVLFDPWAPVPRGVVFPIVLRLCDVNGQNKSSSSVALTVLGIAPVSGPTAVSASVFSGSSFTYHPWLGLYSYFVKTKALVRGNYELRFKAGADPTVHAVPFSVR